MGKSDKLCYIGIDPGMTGAITFLFSGSVKHDPIVYKMPLSGKEVDVLLLEKCFDLLFCDFEIKRTQMFCLIEKAQSMPGQGVVSVANYMSGYGELRALLKIKKIPYQEIVSQKWKAEFSLIKKSKVKKTTVQKKNEAYEVARKLFPDINFLGPQGGLMDGMVDSVLIAEFARRRY